MIKGVAAFAVAVAFWLFAAVMLYFMYAFGCWSFDPATWGDGARAMMMVLLALCLFGAIGVFFAALEQLNKEAAR